MSNKRGVVLGYGQSAYPKNGKEDTPVRLQREKVEQMVRELGYEFEWYEDTGGRESGQGSTGRPEWRQFQKRLEDPDVVGIAIYDLSDILRNLEISTKLYTVICKLEKFILTVIDKNVYEGDSLPDFILVSLIHISLMSDQVYAERCSMKMKDSITRRKSEGKTIGVPPFGTIRNKEGFLEPRRDGVWQLSDGSIVVGVEDKLPEPDAVWRGYYGCTRRVLELYADDSLGPEMIAHTMKDEGWYYRTRNGKPRRLTSDDVRRIIANWPEYGGAVLAKNAKDRPSHMEIELDDKYFNQERAVFDIDLLLKVRDVRKKRSAKPV